MGRTKMVFLRIAGSAVGLVIGVVSGVALGLSLDSLLVSDPLNLPDGGWSAFIMLAGLGAMIGATVGAAVGATLTQRALKQRGSFWRALLVAFVGLAVGLFLVVPASLVFVEMDHVDTDMVGPLVGLGLATCTPIVGAAVIGSGWEAKPAAKARGQTRDQDGPTDLI